MKTFVCPCCGFDKLQIPSYKEIEENVLVRGLQPPYGSYFGEPSYDICSCCGFEFGSDDEPGTSAPVSFEAYLNAWVEEGCNWFSPAIKPENWSLSVQLTGKKIVKNVPEHKGIIKGLSA